MAYENRNAAYDLSLFDQASAAPLPKRDEEVEKVKEPKKKTGKKVISLPEEELHKINKKSNRKKKCYKTCCKKAKQTCRTAKACYADKLQTS